MLPCCAAAPEPMIDIEEQSSAHHLEDGMDGTRAPAIVVGVDGTPASKAALDFAMHEGVIRGCAVEVITVWGWSGPHESLSGPGTATEARERAQRRQNEVVAEALASVGNPPVVSRQVLHGDPGDRLLQAAGGAALLVVGTHHKGVLRRTVLGSVSEHCVRRATCPVVVVSAVGEEAPQPTLTTNATG